MPETVDDFIQRFSGSGTIDDRQASRYFDRFASTRDDDRDFDNDALYEGATQHLGNLDDDEFTRASEQAYEQAPPAARTGILQTIMRGLGGGGGSGNGADFGSLARQIGLRSSSPDQMDGRDYARLANYTRRERPEVMREAVREQPAFVKAMGNPILMGALAMAAAHMLNKQRKGFQQKQGAGRF